MDLVARDDKNLDEIISENESENENETISECQVSRSCLNRHRCKSCIIITQKDTDENLYKLNESLAEDRD